MQPERPVQTTLAFHSSRIVIDVGVLLAMAAMSLPFVVSEIGDRSALDGDALPTMLLLIPIFAVTLIPDHARPLHPIAGWVALALGMAAVPYALVKLLDARILADTLDGSLGFGAILMVIGSVVTLVGIGIGLYRDLRGLPTGGSPGRNSSYETRSKKLAAPGVVRRAERRRRKAEKAGTARRPKDSSSSKDDAAPSAESGETTPAPPQPEIVGTAEGAAPREADAAEGDDLNTAERADAAIDDHILSMFDEADGSTTDPKE